MNLQQMRYLCEIVRQNLHISDAATTLFTSQPGISKQIKLLEDELGIEIFIRNGKRIVALTEPGKAILGIAQRILQETENLKQVGQEFLQQARGKLTLATTHTQARYVLPPVVKRFIERYPEVKLGLHQGNPMQVAEQVLNGEADVAIATESLASYDGLITLPCYDWHHCVVVPAEHPLLTQGTLSLSSLAQYPIITYDYAFSGRGKIDEAFIHAGIEPTIALTAIDADVIKTYVELGLGVGILAEIAFIAERDRQLRKLDASHLFKPNTTKLAVRKNDYLRGYVYDFIEMFSPELSRTRVENALRLVS